MKLFDSAQKAIGHPEQVYLAFKKEDTRRNEQLQINSQAQWDIYTGRFVGSVDFSASFDLVNGKYAVHLVSLDSSIEGPQTWELGVISIWFKEGQSDTNN